MLRLRSQMIRNLGHLSYV